MIPITEFQNRSNEGPLMSANEFDLMLSKKARELVKKYDLKLDTEQIVASDDVADRVFAAAMEFLETVGVYNKDTQRVIRWTREEIEALVADYRENPRVLSIGDGKDAVDIKARTPGDPNPPALWGGGGMPVQQLLPSVVRAYARESCVQGLSKPGGVALVDGVKSVVGTPSEIYCSHWEMKAVTKVLEEEGRPGLFRGNIPTATSTAGMLASMGPDMGKPYNVMFGVHIVPEQKLGWGVLNNAAVCRMMGIMPWVSAMSTVGGLCGGPGGAAMGVVANLLAQLSYSNGNWGAIALSDIKGSNRTKASLAAYSAAHRAVSRNLRLPTASPAIEPAPTGSIEEMILVNVSILITYTVSGAALDWVGGGTPLTCRLHAEVMKNVAAMDRETATGLIKKVTAKADELAAQTTQPMGREQMMFPAIYDMQTLKPRPHYVQTVRNAVEMLKECGVPITDALVLD